ncbi:hypothetical protein CYMTET_39212 [Cymbomonas tetramitiformis]|uniref:Uncharacterized protein n=1 Tax=Cymbomonas tetramitiformis TaxID=36881 RepID=A0AAE0CAH2_9CHLO|nr:hypothetical protein CYMTET_39212 [Cymbomonas tetramitiformis]
MGNSESQPLEPAVSQEELDKILDFDAYIQKPFSSLVLGEKKLPDVEGTLEEGLLPTSVPATPLPEQMENPTEDEEDKYTSPPQ